jgi:hypothetical protein
VLKGTCGLAAGTKFDTNATVPMPAGTFVTHYGQQVHFDGAKDEDTALLIVGEGPATATPAEVNEEATADQTAVLTVDFDADEFSPTAAYCRSR